jgi:hypothetical protein
MKMVASGRRGAQLHFLHVLGTSCCGVLLCSQLLAAESVGTISDVAPPGIQIKLNRNGALSSIGPGTALELGDQLSIKLWCRARKVNSLVVVNTRFGELRLDCNYDEIIIKNSPAAIPLFQEQNKPRTTPTITGQLQRTIDELNRAAFELLEAQIRAAHVTSDVVTAQALTPRESYVLRKVEDIQKSVAAKCAEVVKMRYAIYKVNGFCFSDPKVATALSNQGCRYSSENSVPLSVEDRAAIDRSVAAEQNYCRSKR